MRPHSVEIETLHKLIQHFCGQTQRLIIKPIWPNKSLLLESFLKDQEAIDFPQ